MTLKSDAVLLNHALRLVEKICKLLIEIKPYRWESLI